MRSRAGRAGRLPGLYLGLALVLTAPACGSTGGEPSADGNATRGATSPSVVGFRNPVFASNFPDPMVYEDSDTDFVAVATNGDGMNVRTLLSKDLVSWEWGTDLLPQLPAWSSPGKVWAPELVEVSERRYVLYYTSIGPDGDAQCVGAAVGSRPEAEFVDRGAGPLVCDEKLGGSIDAHAFTTSAGKRYLYWKNDGNAVGLDTYLWVQALKAGGTELEGKPRRLFMQDLPWEGFVVEAPFVWGHEGRFHMFYSANAYDSDRYAVGHAVADSPLGPFIKDPEPVLVSNEYAAGPGHCSLVEKDGRVWMVYHAWEPGSVGDNIPGRTMWLSEVTFNPDGSVRVAPPTVDYPVRP
jgi:beta-xylosidase